MKLIFSREVVSRGNSGKGLRIKYDRKGRKVRTPWTKEGLLNWSQMREALRDLMPSRKPATKLVFAGKCQRCGSRYVAESPRKEYCSKQCQSKAAVARWYPIRKQRGDFKREKARTLQKKRQEAEDRTAQHEQIREHQQRGEAGKLYREVVFGNLDKKIQWQYNEIRLRLGDGDEKRGHTKIARWYRERLEFDQIPLKGQKIFIDCVKKWGTIHKVIKRDKRTEEDS